VTTLLGSATWPDLSIRGLARFVKTARRSLYIDWVRSQAAELEEIVADPLAPEPRHGRERAELVRLQTIITHHEAGVAV